MTSPDVGAPGASGAPRASGAPGAPRPLLTPAGLAAYLDVSERTLRRYRATGEGPPYISLPGGSIRYSASAVARWCERHAR